MLGNLFFSLQSNIKYFIFFCINNRHFMFLLQCRCDKKDKNVKKVLIEVQNADHILLFIFIFHKCIKMLSISQNTLLSFHT